MEKKNEPEIRNRLAELRQKRGLAAAELAKAVSVSRQTIYAMEAGSYVPNTAVALRLARVLEVDVTDLFMLADEDPAVAERSDQVTLLPYGVAAHAGQPVQLCRVDKRMVASAPSPLPWYFPASDAAVINEAGRGSKTSVRVFAHDVDFASRVLVAGCDPGISVLARHLQSAGVELVLAHRNSSQALELLKEGCIHIAGTHLRDDASGESNLPEIRRGFPKNAVAVISYAVWEEGLVTARGNPKQIKSIEDLANPNVTIVNRESGAGSRQLLDAHLLRLGIAGKQICGYDVTAPGHLPAAWQVQTGAADCCIATRAAARGLGLGFMPLVSERYDLALRRQHLDLPSVKALLETLSRSSFRRELESLGGYDTKDTGSRVL
jgi:molybdate-binding protein/DNA-binding XRE family transcriptional regulator